MPLTFANSMRTSGTTGFRETFRWVDDPTEDQAFLDFCIALVQKGWGTGYDVSEIYRNLRMDRSGPDATVRWDHWEPTGPWDPVTQDNAWEPYGAKELVVGAAGSYWADNRSKRTLSVEALDMDVFWECDERGRAYSIDKVVVP